MTVTDAPELWDLCAARLQGLVGLANWKTWFDQLKPIDLDDRLLSLSAPSSVVREKLEERYLSTMQELASEFANRPLVVNISVGPAAATDVPDGELGNTTDGAALGTPSPTESWATFDARPDPVVGDRGRALIHSSAKAGGNVTVSGIRSSVEPLQLNPRYTFEAFVIGGSNSFAHAAAQRVAEKPAESYNPLFIHGASGLGKTHLLHAIGHYVAANFSSKVIRYVSTETFLNEFVDAIRTNGQTVFKRRYRECDLLLIDDVQFFEGKEGLQQEFFHTFNALHDKSKQIVLSSDRPPRSIATLEDRLRSRFEWGLIIDVVPPDLETRLAILRKKAETEHTPIPADVLELIATHVKDNIRELEGALIRVCAYASLNHQAITLEMAERVLSDILDVNRPKQITARRIIDCTSEMFELDSEELRGPKRQKQLVQARQICMYTFRELTQYSYPQIGREFSNRDHTTVMYAVEKISDLMKERQQVYDQVTELIQRIKGTN